MELLAIAACETQEVANQAFMVGIFSLLDTMLGMPMALAVKLLSISSSARQALVEHQGPLANLLALAQACESGNKEALDLAAAALQLDIGKINAEHLQAMDWAEKVSG